MICLGLVVFPVMAQASGRYYERSKSRVETRYRNAGDRIISRTADHVLDRIFGPEEKDKPREDRTFYANVHSSMYVESGYPVSPIKKMVVSVESPDAYRGGNTVDGDTIFREIAGCFSNNGVSCVSAQQPAKERIPAQLHVSVNEYTDHGVSLSFYVSDDKAGQDFIVYDGSVRVSRMTDTERRNAVKAIVADYVTNFLSVNQ